MCVKFEGTKYIFPPQYIEVKSLCLEKDGSRGHPNLGIAPRLWNALHMLGANMCVFIAVKIYVLHDYCSTIPLFLFFHVRVLNGYKHCGEISLNMFYYSI